MELNPFKLWGFVIFWLLRSDLQEAAQSMIRKDKADVVMKLMAVILTVSALLTTSSYPAIYTQFVVPPSGNTTSGTVNDFTPILEMHWLDDAFRVANVASFCCSLLSIVAALMLSVVLLLHMNLSSTTEHEEDQLQVWAAGSVYSLYLTAIWGLLLALLMTLLAVYFSSLSFNEVTAGWVSIGLGIVTTVVVILVLGSQALGRLSVARVSKAEIVDGAVTARDLDFLFSQLLDMEVLVGSTSPSVDVNRDVAHAIADLLKQRHNWSAFHPRHLGLCLQNFANADLESGFLDLLIILGELVQLRRIVESLVITPLAAELGVVMQRIGKMSYPEVLQTLVLVERLSYVDPRVWESFVNLPDSGVAIKALADWSKEVWGEAENRQELDALPEEYTDYAEEELEGTASVPPRVPFHLQEIYAQSAESYLERCVSEGKMTLKRALSFSHRPGFARRLAKVGRGFTQELQEESRNSLERTCASLAKLFRWCLVLPLFCGGVFCCKIGGDVALTNSLAVSRRLEERQEERQQSRRERA